MEPFMTKKVTKGGWNRSHLRTPRTERNGTWMEQSQKQQPRTEQSC